MKGTSIPSSSQFNKNYFQKQINIIKNKLESHSVTAFKTNAKESDGLYGSRKALQRYYIPIESDSPLKPKRPMKT